MVDIAGIKFIYAIYGKIQKSKVRINLFVWIYIDVVLLVNVITCSYVGARYMKFLA